MSAIVARDPLARAYAGRNWLSGNGWVFWLMLLPARRLMREDEDGRIILAAVRLEVQVVWRAWRGGPVSPRIWLWMGSDADEIASRIAASVGALA